MAKVAILGYARDGKAAYEHWSKAGHHITICDENTSVELPAGVASQLGPEWLAQLGQFDILVRTAGLPPHLIAEANPETADILQRVTSNTNEFLRVSPTKNTIGVTGTKGKGTTSTLIAKMLEAAGKKVHLGGNIGIPALELLKNDIQPEDWVVLEQSSFQLIDQTVSPHIALCLMVVSEHLNWHADMDEYVTAKQQLFAHQNSDDVAIYYADNQTSKKIASVSPGTKIPYMSKPGAVVEAGHITIDGQTICKTSDIKLLGQHNWQNICAAITAVWQVTQDVQALASVITSFSGLEHRLELVRELNGVKYYDDSFGTTPETAIVAIQAFQQPKVVILGGSDKGSQYDELAKVVKETGVRQAIVIGDMAKKITQSLNQHGFTDVVAGGSTMAEIVQKAHQAAQSGDVVLLSTGCASFGLFKDYKDRGNQFTQVVQALPQAA